MNTFNVKYLINRERQLSQYTPEYNVDAETHAKIIFGLCVAMGEGKKKVLLGNSLIEKFRDMAKVNKINKNIFGISINGIPMYDCDGLPNDVIAIFFEDKEMNIDFTPIECKNCYCKKIQNEVDNEN